MTKVNPDTAGRNRPMAHKDAAGAKHGKDPRAELGLKPPNQQELPKDDKEASSRAEAQGQKATLYDGNPTPQGADSSVFKPKDDTPMLLKKTKGPRNDQ